METVGGSFSCGEGLFPPSTFHVPWLETARDRDRTGMRESLLLLLLPTQSGDSIHCRCDATPSTESRRRMIYVCTKYPAIQPST